MKYMRIRPLPQIFHSNIFCNLTLSSPRPQLHLTFPRRIRYILSASSDPDTAPPCTTCTPPRKPRPILWGMSCTLLCWQRLLCSQFQHHSWYIPWYCSCTHSVRTPHTLPHRSQSCISPPRMMCSQRLPPPASFASVNQTSQPHTLSPCTSFAPLRLCTDLVRTPCMPLLYLPHCSDP